MIHFRAGARVALYAASLLVQSLVGLHAHALDLRDIIETSIATHPSTQAQRVLQDGARIDVNSARQQFYPTPSIALENVRSGSSDASSRADGTVQTYRLQQPLWTAGRLTAGVNKAQANLRTTAHDHDEAAQQLALRSVQAWSEWYAASLKLAALQSSLQTHQRLYDQLKRRVDNGASAPVDLVLTEGRLAQTLSQIKGIEAQLRSARVRVAQLIGKPVAEDEPPSQSLAMPMRSLAEIEEAALQRAPSLQRQQSLMDARKAELEERKAALWPEIYLRAERQSSGSGSAASSSGAVNRLSIGLSSSFGAGLSSLTALESFQKRMEAAESETESLRRSLREQVQSDWELWRSLQDRLPALEQNLNASRATAEAWDRQFLAGRKSWMEVMNTARELAQAELELADARATQSVATWRLTILGLGWERAVQASRTRPP